MVWSLCSLTISPPCGILAGRQLHPQPIGPDRRAYPPDIVHLHPGPSDLVRDLVFTSVGGAEDQEGIGLPVEIASRILIIGIEALDLLRVFHTHQFHPQQPAITSRGIGATIEMNSPSIAMCRYPPVEFLLVRDPRLLIDRLLGKCGHPCQHQEHKVERSYHPAVRHHSKATTSQRYLSAIGM
jgi:hypothetical protein